MCQEDKFPGTNQRIYALCKILGIRLICSEYLLKLYNRTPQVITLNTTETFLKYKYLCALNKPSQQSFIMSMSIRNYFEQ